MPPLPAQHGGIRYNAPLAAGRRESAKLVKQSELEVLPSMDSPAYYDPPSPISSDSSSTSRNLHGPFISNSGHKLEPHARWQRKGKMFAWGPSVEEVSRQQRARKRLQLCLEQLIPESAAEIGVTPPLNIIEAEEKRRTRKRQRADVKQFQLPHLRSPSPPLATIDLAPMLAIPRTYLDIVTSPAMRYSLGDDSMERGLQRTAAELLEGEKGLMQALGRLREVLRVRERDVPEGTETEKEQPVANGNHTTGNGDADTTIPTTNGHAEGEGTEASSALAPAGPELIPPLPHVSETDNLWRVTQELVQSQPPPTITFTVTPPGAAGPSVTSSTLTPLHRLFTSPSGITFNAVPNPSHPGFTQLTPSHPHYPQHVKYNLDIPNQQRAVDDAIERILELLADCNEYKERLEEARDRVADVARARKRVWSVIEHRASREMDRMEGK